MSAVSSINIAMYVWNRSTIIQLINNGLNNTIPSYAKYKKMLNSWYVDFKRIRLFSGIIHSLLSSFKQQTESLPGTNNKQHCYFLISLPKFSSIVNRNWDIVTAFLDNLIMLVIKLSDWSLSQNWSSSCMVYFWGWNFVKITVYITIPPYGCYNTIIDIRYYNWKSSRKFV